MLTNTKKNYSTLTKLLHWLCTFGIITQFYLIYQRHYLPEKSSWNLPLLLLHKSVGMSLLFLGLLFIIWHVCNTKPALPNAMPKTLKLLAHFVQWCLLFFLVLMPISGYIMSTTGGHSTQWFGLFTWPNLLAKHKNVSSTSYQIHVWVSYLLIGAFSIHTLAALKHHFIDKNNILRRILPGTPKD